MVQVFLDKHPELYQTSLERADLRLMLLAVIIGMTGWATLARLFAGGNDETLHARLRVSG